MSALKKMTEEEKAAHIAMRKAKVKAMLDSIKEKKAQIIAEGGDPKQNLFLQNDTSLEEMIEEKTPEIVQMPIFYGTPEEKAKTPENVQPIYTFSASKNASGFIQEVLLSMYMKAKKLAKLWKYEKRMLYSNEKLRQLQIRLMSHTDPDQGGSPHLRHIL